MSTSRYRCKGTVRPRATDDTLNVDLIIKSSIGLYDVWKQFNSICRLLPIDEPDVKLEKVTEIDDSNPH